MTKSELIYAFVRHIGASMPGDYCALYESLKDITQLIRDIDENNHNFFDNVDLNNYSPIDSSHRNFPIMTKLMSEAKHKDALAKYRGLVDKEEL